MTAYGIPVCPDDGGALVAHADWGQRLWCPSNRHGGNGRFYLPSEAGIGQERVYRKPRREPPTAQAATDTSEGVPAKENTSRVVPVNSARGPKPCKCGCGGMTKGGTFQPGHDAKYHSAMKAAAAVRIKEVLG